MRGERATRVTQASRPQSVLQRNARKPVQTKTQLTRIACCDRIAHMEWTNDLTLQLISEYEKRVVLWDTSHKFYKYFTKKNEAWEEISVELDISVGELKKKINSLLATYRKVRQKMLAHRTAGSGVNETDSSPIWFAYKSFHFLHNKYKPRSSMHIDEPTNEDVTEGEEEMKIKNEDEDTRMSQFSDQQADDGGNIPLVDTSMSITGKPKKQKIFVSPKRRVPAVKHPSKYQVPKFVGALSALHSVVNKKKDEYDFYGEYIAQKLRTMDKRTCAYVQKAFADILFDTEMANIHSIQNKHI